MPTVPETNNETPSHSFLALCLYAASKLKHTTVTYLTSHMGGSDSGSLVSGVCCECFYASLPPLYHNGVIKKQSAIASAALSTTGIQGWKNRVEQNTVGNAINLA